VHGEDEAVRRNKTVLEVLDLLSENHSPGVQQLLRPLRTVFEEVIKAR
jgi:hypothetical protein